MPEYLIFTVYKIRLLQKTKTNSENNKTFLLHAPNLKK